MEAIGEEVNAGGKICRCIQGAWWEDRKETVFGIQVCWEDGRAFVCEDVDSELDNVRRLIGRLVEEDVGYEELPDVVADYASELHWSPPFVTRREI